ncbi:hypothetical protein Tco_1369857 [Tanacetum coccineum]
MIHRAFRTSHDKLEQILCSYGDIRLSILWLMVVLQFDFGGIRKKRVRLAARIDGEISRVYFNDCVWTNERKLVLNQSWRYKDFQDDQSTAAIFESTASVIRYLRTYCLLYQISGSFLRLFEDVITKTVDYHSFDVVVEFHRCVFLSYLLAGGNLFVLYGDEDLQNLGIGRFFLKRPLDCQDGFVLLAASSMWGLPGLMRLRVKGSNGVRLRTSIHQDSRIKKAQELKTKTFANSDIQDLPLRYQVYQGRLLESFQKDAKYEHVGQDIRSQDGKDDQDIQGKRFNDLGIKDKVERQWQRLKIKDHIA